MTIGDADINVSGLRAELREPVYTLADRLLTDLGDNMRSLSVVGSALTPDFHETRSDINTVLVVGRRSHELLKRLAAYQKGWARKARLDAPYLWTEEYLLDSLDVFAVGMLDFQFNHWTVVGDDPFARLVFTRPYVRLQCERELKQILVDLRRGYVLAAGDPRQVGRVLMTAINTLLPLARAVLWLEGQERNTEAGKTIRAVALRFGLNVTAFEEPLKLRDDRAAPSGDRVDAMFEGVYRSIDYLSRQVDHMKDAE